MSLTQLFPSKGQVFSFHGYRFEVIRCHQEIVGEIDDEFDSTPQTIRVRKDGSVVVWGGMNRAGSQSSL